MYYYDKNIRCAQFHRPEITNQGRHVEENLIIMFSRHKSQSIWFSVKYFTYLTPKCQMQSCLIHQRGTTNHGRHTEEYLNIILSRSRNQIVWFQVKYFTYHISIWVANYKIRRWQLEAWKVIWYLKPKKQMMIITFDYKLCKRNDYMSQRKSKSMSYTNKLKVILLEY